MHATTAPVGYLCSYTVANGVQLFKVTYSGRFMLQASAFLQMVFERNYLTARGELPPCDIRKDSQLMQKQHREMLNALADVQVQLLGPHDHLRSALTPAARAALKVLVQIDISTARPSSTHPAALLCSSIEY